MPYIGGAGLNTQKVCLEGTRGEILDEITAWINNTDDTTLLLTPLLHASTCFCFDRNKMAEQPHEKNFTTGPIVIIIDALDESGTRFHEETSFVSSLVK